MQETPTIATRVRGRISLPRLGFIDESWVQCKVPGKEARTVGLPANSDAAGSVFPEISKTVVIPPPPTAVRSQSSNWIYPVVSEIENRPYTAHAQILPDKRPSRTGIQPNVVIVNSKATSGRILAAPEPADR